MGKTVEQEKLNRPLIVTSKTNPHVREAITMAAWEVLQSGGSTLDAAEKAVNVSELDPRDPTVGCGGDPNEDGFHQLDACVMSGPDNNDAGAVAALENIKTPCSVARLVMERSDHLLLVGKGALRFARMHGFKEENLMTDEARKHWADWRENLSARDYYHPPHQKYKPEGGRDNQCTGLGCEGRHLRRNQHNGTLFQDSWARRRFCHHRSRSLRGQ